MHAGQAAHHLPLSCFGACTTTTTTCCPPGPQAAFIVNDTVRGNILFGADFEEGRYWWAVEAACLDQDLKQLPGMRGAVMQLGMRKIS